MMRWHFLFISSPDRQPMFPFHPFLPGFCTLPQTSKAWWFRVSDPAFSFCPSFLENLLLLIYTRLTSFREPSSFLFQIYFSIFSFDLWTFHTFLVHLTFLTLATRQNMWKCAAEQQTNTKGREEYKVLSLIGTEDALEFCLFIVQYIHTHIHTYFEIIYSFHSGTKLNS